MALVPIKWKPDRKLLVEFSEVTMFFLGMVFAPLALWRGNTRGAVILWVLAVLARVIGLIRPTWLRPVFVGMTLASWPIGWVASHLAFAILYYGVVTPVALLFRLIGRDALRRRFDRAAASYWEPYNPDQGPERYLRQF
jgi:hypothetical protein